MILGFFQSSTDTLLLRFPTVNNISLIHNGFFVWIFFNRVKFRVPNLHIKRANSHFPNYILKDPIFFFYHCKNNNKELILVRMADLLGSDGHFVLYQGFACIYLLSIFYSMSTIIPYLLQDPLRLLWPRKASTQQSMLVLELWWLVIMTPPNKHPRKFILEFFHEVHILVPLMLFFLFNILIGHASGLNNLLL